MALLLGGLAFYIAPLPRWRSFLSENWSALLPVLAVGAAAPWVATQIRPIWRLDTIADITFDAVAALTRAAGYAVDTYPAEKIIGAGDFHISVAPQCSGVEGFALVTLFVSLYLWLFRSDMRFPRAFLLFPIGLAASAAFNVLRIAVLLIIGLEGNPDLAVGGFHSHAGWLMFTLVALGIVALAQTVPALRKSEIGSNKAKTATKPLPLLQDPTVLRILPFAVFMFSALLASAFVATPSVVYPARVVLMAATLALFWPLLRALPWRLDPVALLAGAVIAAMWLLIPVEASEAAAPYGALTGGALALWFVARGIGTAVLVPIIEELFFRDYLESRLTLGTGLRWRIFAAIVTAGLFAALHARWLEAFIAGLIFSFVMQRRGNVTDAIVAHALANAIIFGWAVVSGNLSII
jgi:exosortase E/protease (VPEID-CTERM system)